ncbi:MAG TPA: NYN domain-containing protein [Anaerolineales bacterium]|nr:NYN domain-containing protein [Anaerolineales bacterium]
MSNQLAVFIDFENVALWAEQEFLDFEITSLMEYLQSRGPVVIKKAYGDWARFSHYRDQLMENTIDLIQMYSVRNGKNRADIRLAMDALECAITRSQIKTFVIISGDSDFGALVSKLREYGRYTLGIGPRSITHSLLVKSCDEFVYLETALGVGNQEATRSGVDVQSARELLRKALLAHGQRGETPVPVNRLKQTMLLMDPAFNEINLGHMQFKTWLEEHSDLVKLYVKDLELFAASPDFTVMNGYRINQPTLLSEVESPTIINLDEHYQDIYSRLKMNAVDLATRRDVLRDIYRFLLEHPGEFTTDDLLERLREHYDQQGLARSKTMLRQIWQMGFRQRTFDYQGKFASVHVPVWLAEDIKSEADFVLRAESGFVYAAVHAGVEIDRSKLSAILVGDGTQVAYIQQILDNLVQRGQIVYVEGKHRLPGRSGIPFRDEPRLQPICEEIEAIEVPSDVVQTPANAQSLAKTAMLQRSQDFAAAARNCLLACRIQWNAISNEEPGATLEDLRWYMASYVSVKAGELSQVHRDYAASRPYYLAFFSLVQEDDPLWQRMRGLVNPMLAYYWANAGRELGITVAAKSLPAQSAVFAATHSNPDLQALWRQITRDLVEVNPTLVRRVAKQIRLNRGEGAEVRQVADELEAMLPD